MDVSSSFFLPKLNRSPPTKRDVVVDGRDADIDDDDGTRTVKDVVVDANATSDKIVARIVSDVDAINVRIVLVGA